MHKIEVISIDMFQTLVDVNSRKHEAWKEILGEAYTYELAEEYCDYANKAILKYFNEVVSKKDFAKVVAVFEDCYRELFTTKKIMADPKRAAYILAKQHGFARLYEDSEIFMKSISRNYPICLVSDSDSDMILPLLNSFCFDKVFISEEYQSYKFQSNSRIFKEVIKYYNVEPESILHIGDGYSDVYGAKAAGMKACWLNRGGRVWDREIKPDYEVKSLIDIIPLLEISTFKR